MGETDESQNKAPSGTDVSRLAPEDAAAVKTLDAQLTHAFQVFEVRSHLRFIASSLISAQDSI